MSLNSLSSKANFTQTINFKGSETEYSAEIMAQDVTINCSAGDHRNGSSKVKLKNVVDFNWELKYYIGQLIACHVDGKVYAYTIRPKGKCGMFRVVNIETEKRALVELRGTIEDISFALTPQVILGCIDDEGNLFVYSVEAIDAAMSCTLLLHVRHPKNEVPCSNFRVIWCPYVPTFGENSDTIDDPAKLLVLLNGNKAEVWDVSIVNSKYGAGPLEPLDEHEGYVEIDGHVMDVIDASFSPDGTAIATASLDGYVKFFQVYMVESEEPRCLHQWQPHDGKAISCLLFLDNVKSYGISDSKFWKFAITGADHNAEMKIWSCETWSCLQTIRFEPNPHAPIPDTFLKVCLDMSAEYLLMSDINNRIMYILQIQKNEEDRIASIATISEFLLPSPVISFGIVNVTPISLRFASNEDLYEENEDYEDDSNPTAISMKIIVVQPKSLQECTVSFKPEGSIASNIKSVYGNVTETEVVCEEHEEEDDEDEELPMLNDLQSSVTLLIQQQQQQQQQSQPLNLMTPDDFNSPVMNTSPSVVDITSPSIKKENVSALIDFQQPQKDNCASGGSSPSREVQEILSLSKPSYNQEFFDNLNKLDNEETDMPTTDYKSNNNPEPVKTDNVWPNIPMMKALEIEMKEETRRKLTEENKEAMQALNYRLLSLESIIQKQTEQITNLQLEIKAQNGRHSTTEYENRNQFVKEVDGIMGKYHTQTSKMLETHLKEQKRKEREQHDLIFTNLSQHLSKQISDNLQGAVAHEIKISVVPPVLAVFEKLQLQLDMHYSQKLNTIDQLLKTNISKLFNNKSVSDSLNNSIVNIMKPSLENCYKDMILTTMIPSWERVCSTMFQQIHSTFTQGTKEYTSHVEGYVDKYRKEHEKSKNLINQMQAASENMLTNTDKLSCNMTEEMHRQISLSFNNMQDKLSQMITDVVKEQVRIGFRTHAAVLEDSVVNAVRSRAVTPSPHVIDTQVQISQLHSLIVKGNFDKAFQQALSASATASDLALVLYVCERVNPADVFGPPTCILQQHVLLSLIQQLGADLSHHTDVKQRYLQEAILNLETSNPLTKEHVPGVLTELARQLKNFLTTNPGHKSSTAMRMLLMATKAVI